MSLGLAPRQAAPTQSAKKKKARTDGKLTVKTFGSRGNYGPLWRYSTYSMGLPGVLSEVWPVVL